MTGNWGLRLEVQVDLCLALPGQDHPIKLLFQRDLVFLGMKAFVKAAHVEFGQSLLGLKNHLLRDLIVTLLLHHLAVQDELMLVFDDVVAAQHD
jgi:hypothetical protein